MTPIRRSLLALPLLALALPAQAQQVRAGDIVAVQAWSRSAPRGGSGAAFVTLRNTGSQPDRLISATSPAAGRVELHSMVRDGDVMRMREVPGIDLPPGQEVVLRPGGLHVMLMGLSQSLDQGATVPVTLTFQRGGQLVLDVPIQAAGARQPGGHAH